MTPEEEMAAKAKEEKELQEQRLKGLEEGMMQLGSYIKDLGENLRTVTTQLTKKPDPDGDPDKGKKKIDYDKLESFSRKEFMDLIIEQVGSIVEEKVKGVSTKIDETTDQARREKTVEMIKKLKESKKDFEEWVPEMKKLLNSGEAGNVERAYQMARQDDPEKAKKLDEKYFPERKAAEKKPEPTEKKHIFGGLTPTSGKTVESKGQTAEEAAESAFEEVFGSGSE